LWMRWLRGCAFCPVPQLLLPFFTLHQRKRGTDVTDVSESLRKVTQRLAGTAVDLFAVESELVAVFVESADQASSLLDGPAPQGQIFHLPKAANRERALRCQVLRAIEQPFGSTQPFA